MVQMIVKNLLPFTKIAEGSKHFDANIYVLKLVSHEKKRNKNWIVNFPLIFTSGTQTLFSRFYITFISILTTSQHCLVQGFFYQLFTISYIRKKKL